MRFVKTLPLLLGLGAALGSAGAWALPDDREQPIRVQADSAELDDRQGVAVYHGNVIITQGLPDPSRRGRRSRECRKRFGGTGHAGNPAGIGALCRFWLRYPPPLSLLTNVQ